MLEEQEKAWVCACCAQLQGSVDSRACVRFFGNLGELRPLANLDAASRAGLACDRALLRALRACPLWHRHCCCACRRGGETQLSMSVQIRTRTRDRHRSWIKRTGTWERGGPPLPHFVATPCAALSCRELLACQPDLRIYPILGTAYLDWNA